MPTTTDMPLDVKLMALATQLLLGVFAVLTLEGGLRMPPGGLLIHSPGERRAARVLVDGRPATPGAGGTILLRTLPATIRFEP